MAKARNLKGLDKVLLNLGKEVKKIEGHTLKGLIRGAIVVIRDTDISSPKIPIDEGNLRASRFLTTSKGEIPAGKNPKFKGDNANDLDNGHSSVVSEAASKAKENKFPYVIFGFTANYAAAVHEAVDSAFKRPGSGAKFLESSLKNKKAEILKIIAEEARIKG